MSDGGELVPELGFAEATLDELRALGHRISSRIDAHGGYQAIWREDGPRRYSGGSDPRKDGCAVAF